MIKDTLSVKIFRFFNGVVLLTAAILCLAPFVNLLATSLSTGHYVAAGRVSFFPVGFNIESYQYVFTSARFIRSFMISVYRVLLGVSINIIVVIMCAYPLSKNKQEFRQRGIYSWYFIITMLFAPSLIPSFLVVMNLGLLDSMWALVLPGALPVFSVIVMLNFFRNLPKELLESAFVDGAGHVKTLIKIVLPLSKPSIATIVLFSAVGHWNSWFDGMIYMNRPINYPLQTYLQTILITPATLMRDMQGNPELINMLILINNHTLRAAQLFIATVPILLLYPFLQKYFITGLVLGSVKE